MRDERDASLRSFRQSARLHCILSWECLGAVAVLVWWFAENVLLAKGAVFK